MARERGKYFFMKKIEILLTGEVTKLINTPDTEKLTQAFDEKTLGLLESLRKNSMSNDRIWSMYISLNRQNFLLKNNVELSPSTALVGVALLNLNLFQTKECEEKVKKVLNIKAGHIEGKENAQWVLIDFIYIVVHIFQKEFRDYYKLEELWGDADIIKIDDE